MNRFKDISRKFPTEAAAVGRLLAGYADLEIRLMHCVQMARGGDLDTVLKAMFGKRGETRRINTAATLGKSAYDSLALGSRFSDARGLSRCPREPHMMYSNLAAGHMRRARGAPSGKGTISERIPGEFSRRDELRGVSV